MDNETAKAVAQLKELDRRENDLVNLLRDEPNFEALLDDAKWGPLDGLSERDAEIVKINARLSLRTIHAGEELET